MGAEPSQSEGTAGELLRDGLVVRDGFLSASRTLELARCAAVRRTRGEFVAARVGTGGQRRQREEIRGDSTCWLSEPLFVAERHLLDDLEGLRRELNRTAYLGLFDLELHYARYPAGAGYVRHLDQLQGRDQRRVSMILYLNDAWQHDCGGKLRIFDAAGDRAAADRALGHRDIEPAGGRLVYFLTEGREHEVLPATRERWSVSGWFRTREPGSAG